MNLQAKVKGLFGLSLLLGFLLFGAALWTRFTALPDLAALLPENDTTGFFMVQTGKMKSNETALENLGPYANLSWVDAVGAAQVGKNTVTVLEINSSQVAEEYLQSRRTEGETLTVTKPTPALWSKVYCYSASQNPCYTWLGKLLLLSEDKNTLLRIQKVIAGEEASLKKNPNFQNVKSRLARWNGGFIYLDLEKILPSYAADFPTFAPLLNLYQGFGTSLQFTQANAFSAESFLAVQKNILGDTAYWSPIQKMAAEFWPWTSDHLAIEWDGMDAGRQILRMQKHLQTISPKAATLFANELQTRLNTIFGPDVTLTELTPLLDGEQYFGFTLGSDFLFLTHFDSEEEIKQALQLKDLFAANYLFPKTVKTASGEMWQAFKPMKQNTGKHEEYQYYDFLVDNEPVATVIFTENTAIIASNQTLAFDTLDRMKGRLPPRSMDTVDSLLPGSNELFSVHCLLLPDGSILRTLLSAIDHFTLARKVFDDGSFARSTIQLATP